MPPGDYDLFVRTGDPESGWVRRVGVFGAGTLEIPLTLPKPIDPRGPTNSLVVEVTASGGVHTDGAWVVCTRIDDPDGWQRAGRVWLGSVLFTLLEPGLYRVSLRRGWDRPLATEGDSKQVLITTRGAQQSVRLELVPRAAAR